MQTFGGILLVGVLFTVVALGTHYWRTMEELDASRRTVEGYLTLIEGLYAYRAENVSRWPASFTDLTPYLPLLQIDSVDPMQAGSNGEGGRYTLAILGGNVALTTHVRTESHARSVTREFGARGSYAAVTDGFRITVAVPTPGGITLMRQTLLTDGTNKMQRPLWIATTVATGDSCTGAGFAVDTTGNLMRCHGGVWQAY
ncbi:MAG: hypothetical protein OXG25_10175 [Gammaproteobacteria bacterium]|nr:hypothetical protein [Gammaproteobacteria bacterium]